MTLAALAPVPFHHAQLLHMLYAYPQHHLIYKLTFPVVHMPHHTPGEPILPFHQIVALPSAPCHPVVAALPMSMAQPIEHAIYHRPCDSTSLNRLNPPLSADQNMFPFSRLRSEEHTSEL